MVDVVSVFVFSDVCGLKPTNVCVSQEKFRIQSRLLYMSSELIIYTVVFMAFCMMCTKYVASRDIYLTILKKATSLPCFLSTCPNDNQTNISACLLSLYFPNIL
jgi:hypothetical protein